MAGKSMRELSESDELKTFFDRRLIKALGHPVREHILAVLNERIASGSEIGEELGADVSSFYHHIEELEKLGCIERVATKQRRGANEHFFKAKVSLFFDDAAWQRVPGTLKADQTVSNLQNLFDDVVAALEGETFNVRDNPHVSWLPGFVDVQGWDEATALMNQTLERLLAIREAAASRLAVAGEPGIPATMGILAFETPARVDGAGGA
jgi:DNA-binding transcriptional ArsR family regulator